MSINLAGVLTLCGVACGTMNVHPQPFAKRAASPKAAKRNQPYFLHLQSLRLESVIAPPPVDTSGEYAQLRQIQRSRTEAQALAAKADDAEEDIFVYRTIFGPGFNARALPLTAQLSAHIHQDEGFVSKALKTHFERPRPYQVDNAIHPVCKVTAEHNAYPSGHTLSGYLLALTLTQIVPEETEAILARADDYAHNRLVCGVHTQSDIDASLRVAYAVFGGMVQDQQFQKELAAARAETRSALKLKPLRQ